MRLWGAWLIEDIQAREQAFDCKNEKVDHMLDRNDLIVYPMDPMALTPSYTVEYPAIAGQERAASRHIVMLGLCK
jgi:hypothetical protein